MRPKIRAVKLTKAADYFEPLMRARLVAGMRAVRAAVTVTDLAMAMGNARQAAALVTRRAFTLALGPAGRVARDAFRQGGRIGAARVRDL